MVGGHGEGLVEVHVAEQFVNVVLSQRVGEGKAHLAGLLFFCAIADLHGELQLVALAHETRRVGLHHDVLGGDGAAAEETAAQFVVVGKTHELPFGERLGHGEFQRHFAVLIGNEVWHEESGFIEVLARGHLREVRAGLFGTPGAGGLTAFFFAILVLGIGISECRGGAGERHPLSGISTIGGRFHHRRSGGFAHGHLRNGATG